MPSGDTGSALIGRAADLAGVRAVLATRRAVVVVGEAGVGKTSLLTAALDGRAVRAGRCFRSLSAAGAAPLQQALAGPLPVGDPTWTARWIGTHLGRAVLRIDDLQWADALTLAAVALLVDRVPMAVTVRTGDRGTDTALEALAGFVRVDLAPLPAAEAAALAARAHPRLHPDEATRLAARCGGNPLLIEELGHGPDPSLRNSLVRRLRRMGPDPWTGFALLALAGEPVPASWVPGLHALTTAGLLQVDDVGTVLPRHPVLAETVTAQLADDPVERERVELLLAQAAERTGWTALAAGAYAAAGDRVAALRLARQAATASDRPGERAALLRVAAESADGHEAADLAAAAVAELVVVGEYDAAAALIATLPEQRSASWLSLVGRVRWQTGDDDLALAAFEQARDIVEAGTREDVRLQCEHARALALSGRDPDRALELARTAQAASEVTGYERSRALAVLGTVEYFADRDDDVGHLAAAVAMAPDDPDADLQVEFSAVNNLVAALESRGELADAVARADAAAVRADALRLRGWGRQMQAMALNARLHRGDYGPIVAVAPDVLDEAVDRRTRDQLEVTLGLALVDLGRVEQAERRLGRALARCVDDHVGRGNLTWVRAEALLWSGDPQGALDVAHEAIRLLPGASTVFPLVTRAHAEARLGRPVSVPTETLPTLPVVAAVPHELAGLTARAAGDRPAARAALVRATELWRGRHRRGEQRCRWLAADVADDLDVARSELTALELELAADGWAPLLGAVRRSLRDRGVRRSAPRGRSGGLTTREREVLDLVAEGLSTDAVAARLGLSSATVAALVASARTRLGAANRWQAVSDR